MSRSSVGSARPRWRAVLFVVVAFLPGGGGLLAAGDPAVWSPQSLADAPVIDGVLDDPAWGEITPLVAFRQVEPVTGATPTKATEVFLAYDAGHLYFAIIAHDGEPSGIVATQQKRDADLSGDDSIVLVLDPFLDQRNGYYFAFNALGAKQDALIRGGDILNTDWDGLWEVVARRTAEGWIAEGAIPFSTLTFKAGIPAWGLNLERYIGRTGERVRWNGTQRQYEVNNLGNAGRLTGLAELRRASAFELRPFATVAWSDDRTTDRQKTHFKPGFDLFYQLTESTTAVLTVNTDFADAEVDDRVVNLTRFPVKFPEKRAFFLQDAGVFSYSLINNNPLPYYSRRIGLGPRGEIVDLLGGVRISGREGPVNFGLLGVRTERSGPLEAKELAVGRVLFNLSDETTAGFIGTWGDPRTNGEAWLAGADLNYTTGRLFGQEARLLDASLYFQRTGATGREADSDAFGWGLVYDSPTWGFTSYLDRVGVDYHPALGRVNQTGVYTVTGKVDYEFNPAPLKNVVPIFSYVRRHSLEYHDREQETYGPEVTVETVRGDKLWLRLRQEDERLPEPFTVGPGVIVAPGDFSGQRLQAELVLSKSRPLSADLGVARIPYYGGYQLAYTNTVTWRPSALFNLEATYDYTDVHLPHAQFPVRLIKLGATVQFSQTLIWSVLGQYDNLSHAVGFNTRIRWTYAPGGDVYFVINEGATVIDDRWEFTRTEISAKVSATWRF